MGKASPSLPESFSAPPPNPFLFSSCQFHLLCLPWGETDLSKVDFVSNTKQSINPVNTVFPTHSIDFSQAEVGFVSPSGIAGYLLRREWCLNHQMPVSFIKVKRKQSHFPTGP